MSVQTSPRIAAKPQAQGPDSASRLWRIGGWLSIAFVVLTFAATPLQTSLTLGSKPSKAEAALVTGPMTKYFVGGYIEVIATLLFLALGLVFARVLRGQSETNRWVASCIAGATAVFVAVTLATSYAAGGAALYGGHHGASLSTVTTVNDIRNFGWALSGAIGGVFALAVSGAGHLSRRLPRWLSYVGYVIGTVLIGAMPLVKAGEPQSLLLFVWLVVLGIVALRRPGHAADPAPQAVAG